MSSNKEYHPDYWVVIKLTNKSTNDIHYRVFASWSGGYLHGSSWKINSGITEVKSGKDHWYFYGGSGSVYQCSKLRYGLNGYGQNVLNQTILDVQDEVHIEILEDQDWSKLDCKD